MMKFILALTALLSANAFALGPIPNGTYAGTEECSVGAFASEITFTNKPWSGMGR